MKKLLCIAVAAGIGLSFNAYADRLTTELIKPIEPAVISEPEKVTLGTRVGLGKDHVIHKMCDAIRQLAVKYRDGAALQGIGIGVPGNSWTVALNGHVVRDAISIFGASRAMFAFSAERWTRAMSNGASKKEMFSATVP